MLALARRWLPLALLALAALWLRTHDLARRPMHADEANQAVKLGELLESGRYAFDPRDHHGPTLYYAAVPIAWLRGEHTLAALTETTVRLVPALAGTLSVVLLYLLLSGGGAVPSPREPLVPSSTQNPKPRTQTPESGTRNPELETRNHASALALLAAAFLAVSPPAVYYSRYFIQETLLLTFTLATFVCAQRWWRRATAAWALATGACVGLMLATKASAPLFLLAAVIAFAAARLRRAASLAALPSALHPPAPFARALALALAAALLTAALFYSSFGTHLAGLRDAFAAYGFASHRLAGATGHEKPWWYYATLLAWREDGGLVFQQLAFTALALAGAALAFFPPRLFSPPSPPEECHIIDDTSGKPAPDAPRPSASSPALLRAAAVYTFLLLAVLSLTPYKTPWHAVHLVPGLAVLAAATLTALPRPWLAALFALAVLWLQFTQTRLAVFVRPADARNPYAYVHTSPDVLKIRPLADAALARQPAGVIRVIGEEYWPLPWYLRGLPHVGYWSAAPDDCDGALVIASAAQADAVRARLHGHYRESLLGLRPGLLCVVFTPTRSEVASRMPWPDPCRRNHAWTRIHPDKRPDEPRPQAQLQDHPTAIPPRTAT